MFEFRKKPTAKARASWLASGLLHVAVVALAITVSSRPTRRVTFISLAPHAPSGLPRLPPLGGTEPGRGPSGGLGHPVPLVPTPAERAAPTPLGAVDSSLAASASASAVGRHIIPTRQLADSRIWPSPRPALPADVAQALYSTQRDTVPRDSVAVHRLRAMVDSLNQMIDIEQREHRLPAWTTDVGGKKFGLDSSGIYVAGVKIPAAVLAVLGNMLPQGNFDASLRGRQMEDIRQDILQAARRTETLQQFRRYVHELRQRKQTEYDADRRARGDTMRVKRDTAKAVP